MQQAVPASGRARPTAGRGSATARRRQEPWDDGRGRAAVTRAREKG